MSVAILITLCSKNQDWKKIEDIDFIVHCLDSLISTRSGKYNFNYYLGYDENDEFFVNNIDLLKKRLSMFYFLELPKKCNGNPCLAWTLLYEKALECEKNEYFYQLGSDILHLVKGWDEYFIDIMKKHDNDCIVGGVETMQWINRTIQGQSGILENVFTGRKHYERFGWFFPPEVKSWYSDDLITKVYRNVNKCFIATNIKFKNTNRVGDENELSRYKPPTDKPIAKNWDKVANKYSAMGFKELGINETIFNKVNKFN